MARERITMARMVIADASPLIGLSIVDGLEWLGELFGSVYSPESVKLEVLSGKVSRGEKAIADAIEVGWVKVWSDEIIEVLDVDLDKGETDCINIALSRDDPTLLIMDERAGRAVAKENGLIVTGTAALIGAAKKQGLIPSAKAKFEILHQSDFRISANIIKEILENVGEL